MEHIISNQRYLPNRLRASIYADRNLQFVSRLQWDLCVTPCGHEIDVYDDDNSEYLVVHRNERHLGSCRVRPTTFSTMLVDHFLDAFPEAEGFIDMQRDRIYELTRFCRSPHISTSESKEMLNILAQLLDSFRDRKKLSGFVAVVFPHVARFLDSIGVRYLIVAKAEINEKMTYMICITHAVKVEESKAKKLFFSAPASVAKIPRIEVPLVS